MATRPATLPARPSAGSGVPYASGRRSAFSLDGELFPIVPFSSIDEDEANALALAHEIAAHFRNSLWSKMSAQTISLLVVSVVVRTVDADH